MKELTTELSDGGVTKKEQGLLDNMRMSIQIARDFPRKLDDVDKKLRLVCSDVDFAESAIFVRPVGNKEIRGPSIRLAEELARIVGNIEYGAIRHQGESTDKFTKYEVMAFDKESNVIARSFHEVSHYRHKKDGNGYYEKRPQQISEMVDADVSKKLRTQIFRIIPKTLTIKAYNYCMQTIKTGRRKAMTFKGVIEAFQQVDSSITQEMIEKKIGLEASAMNKEHFAELRIYYKSLINGDITVAEMFSKESKDVLKVDEVFKNNKK